jgi:hypothetical protein
MGRSLTIPWSFPAAIMLPENVIAPTIIASMIEMETSGVRGLGSATYLKNSAAATNAEAPPPKPLRIPTIWGMGRHLHRAGHDCPKRRTDDHPDDDDRVVFDP